MWYMIGIWYLIGTLKEVDYLFDGVWYIKNSCEHILVCLFQSCWYFQNAKMICLSDLVFLLHNISAVKSFSRNAFLEWHKQ